VADERSVVVVGAGVFGVTAAIELSRRGFAVTLVDQGPLPHPRAASVDTSRAVRADYGGDEFYAELAERAMDRWRQWNRQWAAPLFHEVGFLVLTRLRLAAGTFEGDSFALSSTATSIRAEAGSTPARSCSG